MHELKVFPKLVTQSATIFGTRDVTRPLAKVTNMTREDDHDSGSESEDDYADIKLFRTPVMRQHVDESIVHSCAH